MRKWDLFNLKTDLLIHLGFTPFAVFNHLEMFHLKDVQLLFNLDSEEPCFSPICWNTDHHSMRYSQLCLSTYQGVQLTKDFFDEVPHF